MPKEQRLEALFLCIHVKPYPSYRFRAGYDRFVRDFKKYTSNEMQRNIIATEPSVLRLFLDGGKSSFWQDTNMPKTIESESYFLQKMNYIHNNPARKQYVQNPEHWLWSSANPDSPIKIEAVEI